MTTPADITFVDVDLEAIADTSGRVAVFLGEDCALGREASRVNRVMRGALARFAASDKAAKMKQGEVISLAWPTGMAAEAVDVVRLNRRSTIEDARKAGANLGKLRGKGPLLVLAGPARHAAEIAFGIALRGYDFDARKSAPEEAPEVGGVTVMTGKPEDMTADYAPLSALVDGVFFTRDLVNEPANVLTTTEFAQRIKDMESLGLKVTVLEEADMEKLGMGSLLCVGQGSESPSKLAIMEWNGGEKDAAPFALVGKGVVFDTGGISLKPAAGMEDMTMDMGGAGVVAGVMRALALRKAKANVVGLVGLVENMPSGNATRPGDIVKSMKGDTIEVINTDAEGRLVLADVLWYAQETFQPVGMINLATLTGAMIIALGHDHAGAFSNSDELWKSFEKAAATEGEGVWRLPMGQAYDDLIKSPKADMKNVGGRAAGSITAAQFLKRFVKDDVPWMHLDIAGVATHSGAATFAPKGASGWGVLALNRLIADGYEG
ncbi:leucyl aminopeptidase [Mesobacterium pallidum]|uniref:leucyl aminopeptidase n=1 Tax=Mesobacterium pallidum TaxID=2872037 RepID=UPI001EE38350|nr:leucyl aminopeptidase [Mesobacterium pallidum]